MFELKRSIGKWVLSKTIVSIISKSMIAEIAITKYLIKFCKS